MRKPVFGLKQPWTAQSKMTKKEEGLYYLCSENRGANQLCSDCTADLHLCFRICKKQVFS